MICWCLEVLAVPGAALCLVKPVCVCVQIQRHPGKTRSQDQNYWTVNVRVGEISETRTLSALTCDTGLMGK